MRAIMESAFDGIYLVTVLVLGVLVLRRAKGRAQYVLFGAMAIVLGCGDAFHLVPRMLSLNMPERDFTSALGAGQLVTSITMTIFYVMLYHVWRLRYGIAGKTGLTALVYALAAARIALCLFPQNRWTHADAPYAWGIWRNIPFALLGIVIIVLFYRSAKRNQDRDFRFMWLAVALSFAFYIPVVLLADAYPLVGMLMIPKTCAYVWVVCMGYLAAGRKPEFLAKG